MADKIHASVDEGIAEAAREEAARLNMNISAYVEAALREKLSRDSLSRLADWTRTNDEGTQLIADLRSTAARSRDHLDRAAA